MLSGTAQAATKQDKYVPVQFTVKKGGTPYRRPPLFSQDEESHLFILQRFSHSLFAVAIKMALISGQTLKVFKTFRV